MPSDIYGESGNAYPIASASANVTSGTEPLTVNFTGEGTDSDGTIVSYGWNFGDGNTSLERNPSHTYNTAGNYTAVLTVIDNEGASDTDSVNITVQSEQSQIPVDAYYVRPTGGSYGSENGTSYDNAWDGFSDIDWDALSENLPATLYVCGSHSEQLTVRSGGTSESARLTVRVNKTTA